MRPAKNFILINWDCFQIPNSRKICTKFFFSIITLYLKVCANSYFYGKKSPHTFSGELNYVQLKSYDTCKAIIFIAVYQLLRKFGLRVCPYFQFGFVCYHFSVIKSYHLILPAQSFLS